MALSRALILIALTATIFSTMAVAEDFIVGDHSGWTTWFDYKTWAANKVFRVGDTLTFKYSAWKDNVIRVNGSDFINCSVPKTAQVWNSGHDTILLTSPGRRWYISGVAGHCKSGQKLFINVLPPQGSWWSPTPAPPSPSSKPIEVVLTPAPAPKRTWWSPTRSPFASPSPSPSSKPAEIVLTPAPSPSPSSIPAEVVLTPAPAPAPWTPIGWKPKNLFKLFQ